MWRVGSGKPAYITKPHGVPTTKKEIMNIVDNGYQIPGIIQEAAPCVVFWYVCALRHLCSCALAGGILTCCLLFAVVMSTLFRFDVLHTAAVHLSLT